MPGCVPQIALGDVRCKDELVSALYVLIAEIALDGLTDQGALWVPEHQPTARLVADIVEVQLFAELAVIAFLGLGQTGQIGVEVLFLKNAVAYMRCNIAFDESPRQ